MSSTLTARDLIDRLSAVDPDTPVRLAVNPFFPLEHTIAGVLATTDALGNAVLYVVESGQQLGPVPPAVTVGAGWHEPTEAPRRRRSAVAGKQQHTDLTWRRP
ncbi:hypothetical protein [Streptomyces sp. CC208A]|uniref:hypothetical protein n=1 Tax=Streptomyces sp. CC208A TaxID=3044573 RepID=UPI0024A7BF4C|nr:hypothetical protein [Streptomyces sp. CC208A]